MSATNREYKPYNSDDEDPDFNGLSREAFEAGNHIWNAFAGLAPEVRTELLPHVVQVLIYELLGEEHSDAQGLERAASSFEMAARVTRDKAARIASGKSPDELSPDQY